MSTVARRAGRRRILIVIRFSLFGIPVAIKPSFWLIALLLGFDRRMPASLLSQFLAMWVVIVFVSILAHEMGHAIVARRFGARTSITLFVLGGYTTWEAGTPLSPFRRVAVAASGSGVGFVLGGLVWALSAAGVLSPEGNLLRLGLSLFVAVNLFWGILNWLPIRPLDGGHIFSGLAQILTPRHGERVADFLFPAATLAAGLWAWSNGFVFASLLAVFVMVDEVRRWGDRRGRRRRKPSRPTQTEAPFSLFGPDESRGRQLDDSGGIGDD